MLIAPLADHPDAIPALAAGFHAEWRDHYGARTPADIEADFAPSLQRDAIPIALVALRDGIAVGTATLRADSITTHPHLGPWLAAFWVHPAARGEGIGRRLIAAIEREARRLGHSRLYAGSGRAAPLFERAGWRVLERVPYHGERIAILRRELDGALHGIEIAPAPLTSPVAVALITALNAELAATYPEPGATHFRLDPDEVAPGAGVFLVARWDGRPVGCGAVRALRQPELVRELGANVGEVKRMYVAPDARGRGVGRALLERLESEARALGLARLVLETGTRQAEALALYRRAGFGSILPYGEYAASAATSVCLAKELVPT